MDPKGEMLEAVWESVATRLAICKDVDIPSQLDEIVKQFKIPECHLQLTLRIYIIIVILNSLWPVFILVKTILTNVMNISQSVLFFQLIRRVPFPARAAVSLPSFLPTSST